MFYVYVIPTFSLIIDAKLDRNFHRSLSANSTLLMQTVTAFHALLTLLTWVAQWKLPGKIVSVFDALYSSIIQPRQTLFSFCRLSF